MQHTQLVYFSLYLAYMRNARVHGLENFPFTIAHTFHCVFFIQFF